MSRRSLAIPWPAPRAAGDDAAGASAPSKTNIYVDTWQAIDAFSKACVGLLSKPRAMSPSTFPLYKRSDFQNTVAYIDAGERTVRLVVKTAFVMRSQHTPHSPSRSSSSLRPSPLTRIVNRPKLYERPLLPDCPYYARCGPNCRSCFAQPTRSFDDLKIVCPSNGNHLGLWYVPGPWRRESLDKLSYR